MCPQAFAMSFLRVALLKVQPEMDNFIYLLTSHLDSERKFKVNAENGILDPPLSLSSKSFQLLSTGLRQNRTTANF